MIVDGVATSRKIFIIFIIISSPGVQVIDAVCKKYKTLSEESLSVERARIP